MALEGADFVVNTALAAPHERLRAGWAIAQRLGYNWGGSFHIMYDEPFWVNFYQFRLFESVIEDSLELCPGAWHLVVANPVLADVKLDVRGVDIYDYYPNKIPDLFKGSELTILGRFRNSGQAEVTLTGRVT